jgi:trimeric autotransporter adhesin
MANTPRSFGRWAALLALGLGLSGGPALALVVSRQDEDPLRRKRLSRPNLSLAMDNAPLAEVLDRLPNRAAWEGFTRARAAAENTFHAFVDPGTGTARSITRSVPLIPGSGVRNRVTLQSLGQRLGRAVPDVDADAVGDATLAHVREQHALLGIDPAQLGPPRAVRVTTDLWHVVIPQRYRGLPVRDSVAVAAISHGNLVAMGADGWGNVAGLDATPTLAADTAAAVGFAYADGRTSEDEMQGPPVLEVVGYSRGVPGKGGPAVGAAYEHRLVWSFAFRRRPAVALWEVMVDAHDGSVLSFQDLNHYAKRHITGGVYPFTSTETCPTNSSCGEMQAGWPMPFAATGFPAPNDLTNSAGVFDSAGGTATTTFLGRYFTVEGHAPFSASSSGGSILLGGANGQHDLVSPGSSAGNTAAGRTTFYELNKIAEIARGYLPFNEELRGDPVLTFVNEDDTCNAYYQPRYAYPAELHFFRSGPYGSAVCRNSGELAAIVDHEWGHWLDDHDTYGGISGETNADVAALFRTQVSCVGIGFYQSNTHGCGMSPDGTGPNVDMRGLAGPLCTTQCSGARDADWAKHAAPFPAVAPEYNCRQCRSEDWEEIDPHCWSAPSTQAVWDLAARDLRDAPFNLDSQSAFIAASKMFYQGSGTITQWFILRPHACEGENRADGCGITGGYTNFLVADDDNGDINDGTPHMTAIHAAFSRHGIDCAQPATIVNSGCAGGPTGPATLTATPGHYKVDLSWTSVAGATRYWVFRGEGHAGCNYGKALIAEVAGLTYVDTQVAAFRPYSYTVVPAGTSSACYGRASQCRTVTPTLGSYTVSCAPASLEVGMGGSATTTCTATSTGGYADTIGLHCAGLPTGASCSVSPATAPLPPGGSVTSTVTVSAGAFARGEYAFQVSGTPSASPASTHAADVRLTVRGADDLVAAHDPVLRAPACRANGASCDTGSLVAGRGLAPAPQGPEPNQPNTLQASCADGAAAPLGANDRIVVRTADGTRFAAGKPVTVTATIRSGTWVDDALDFFHAGDAAAPSWTLFATLTPGSGSQALTASTVLPRGALQAVRVQYRRGGSGAACAAGTANDRDDVVFAVE